MMHQPPQWLSQSSQDYLKADAIFKKGALFYTKGSLAETQQYKVAVTTIHDAHPKECRLQSESLDLFVAERSRVLLRYDPSLSTRNACYWGLGFSFIIGVSLIVWGVLPEKQIFIYDPVVGTVTSSRTFRGSGIHRDLFSLALNICVTICELCLGMIHSLSLKWSLFQESKLKFNTNIRLISFSRTSWANSWIINIVYILALATCYSASSACLNKVDLTSYAPPNANLLNTDSDWYFTRSGPLCLGGGLLIQCMICVWCLLVTEIPTWSSHPLNTLAAARCNGLQHQPGRCMLAVHDDEEAVSTSTPKTRQKSAFAARKSVSYVLLLLVVSLLLAICWASVLVGRQYTSGTTSFHWRLLPFIGRESNVYGSNVHASIEGAELLQFLSQRQAFGVSGELGIFRQIMFALIFQSVMTITLHCAELQVLLARDESLWRAAGTASGTDSTVNAFKVMIQSWQSVTLLIFKPLLNWLFGLAMFITYNGLFMFAAQVVWLCCGWTLLFIFILFVSFSRPEGPQPATYGHLQTLSNLVDDWSPTLFWGDKSGVVPKIYHAGTASHRLQGVYMNAMYAGKLNE